MRRQAQTLLYRVTLVAVAGMSIASAFGYALLDFSDGERARLLPAVAAAVPLQALLVLWMLFLAVAPLRRVLADEKPTSLEVHKASETVHRLPAVVAASVLGSGILGTAFVVERMLSCGMALDLSIVGACIGVAGATLGAMFAYGLSVTTAAQIFEVIGIESDPALSGTVRAKTFVLGFGLVTLSALALGPTAYVYHRNALERDYLRSVETAFSSLQAGPPTEASQVADLIWRSTGAATAVVGPTGVLERFGPGEAPFKRATDASEERIPKEGWLLARHIQGGLDVVAFLPEGPLEARRSAFGLALMKVALVVYLSCAVMAFLAARAITYPFRSLGRAADRVATGDLTASPPSLSRDEVGQLATDFRRMTQGLKALVVDVQSASENVSLGAREAGAIGERVRGGALGQRTGVDKVRRSVEGMDESIAHVSRGLGGLSEYVSGTSTSVAEMATALEEVRRKGAELERAMGSALRDVENLAHAGRDAESTLGDLEGLANHAGGTLAAVRASMSSLERAASDSEGTATLVNEMAHRAGGVVEETVYGIDALRAAVADAHRRITSLGQRSDDVEQVVDFISEVAGRTNLLSLNASIIASQAGEHGKAFSVVADQIRELAVQIARSTKSIAEIIHSVREEIDGTTALIDRGDALAVEGVQLARNSLEALENIQRSTSSGIETAAAIRVAVDAHGNSAREVSQLVESVANGSRAVAQAVQLVGRSSTAVNTVSRSVSAMADQVAHALEEQSSQGSRQLESLVRLEKMIAEISNAVEDHNVATRRVRDALENLSHTAGEHESAVQGLSGAADRLGARARVLEERVGRFKV